MKHAHRFRIIAFLVCIAVIGGVFAACTSGDPNATSTTPSTAAATDSTDAASSAAGSQPPTNQDVVKLRFFQEEIWWPYTTWEGRIPEKITEKTGVALEVTIAADMNALNLMIASGDMGDLISSGQLFTRLSDSNLCYNWDELNQEYYGRDFEIHSATRFVNTAPDGNLYTVFVGFSPDCEWEANPKGVLEGAGLVVREDLLEEFGNPEVKTIADIENLMAQCKAAHPDIVPITFNIIYDAQILKILMGSSYQTTGFIDMDGKPKVFLKDPRLWPVYEKINEWYRLGYISDENLAFTQDSQDYDWMLNGKQMFASFHSAIADGWNRDLKAAGSPYRVKQLYDFEEPDAKNIVGNGAGWRGMFIPKSCANPKAAIDFVNYMFTEEGRHLALWGEEGIDWNWNEDKTYPILNYGSNRDGEDGYGQHGIKIWGFLNHQGFDNSLHLYGQDDSDATMGARQWLTDIAEINPVTAMIRLTPDSKEAVAMAKIEDLYKNMQVEIYTAPTAEAAREKYEEMLRLADELGALDLEAWAEPQYTNKKIEYDRIRGNLS
ncbi:MAG: hypothetical protein LBV27_03135 [Oscillospiraceae bacterium]|jgi:ABC-type glycerol-3-phosphate transport system substrate-binding protein|nr:hypothetical protein [Oscillospiraceae bacterium]